MFSLSPLIFEPFRPTVKFAVFHVPAASTSRTQLPVVGEAGRVIVNAPPEVAPLARVLL